MAMNLIVVFLLLAISLWFVIWYRARINLRWQPAALLRLALIAVLLVVFFVRVVGDSQPGSHLTEVMLLDVSDSIDDQTLAEAKDLAIEWQQAGPFRTLIAFGDNYQYVLSEDWPEVDASASTLDQALLAAQTILQAEAGRVIIASDGNFNQAGAEAILTEMIASGNQVDFIELTTENHTGDIYISALDAPAGVWANDQMVVDVTIYSPRSDIADLGLTINGVIQPSIPLEVQAGTHTYSLQMNAGDAGILLLGATIKWDEDGFIGNNTYYAAVEVYPAPRILLISSQQSLATILAGRLGDEGFEIELIAPNELSTSLSELSGYQAIMLYDVLAQQLTFEQMQGLKTFVVDFGRSLLIFGGRNSYSLGGYEDTLLEPLLPVDLTPPERIERVPSTYVMVLDRSGSMLEDESTEISPMDLTKEAAIRAIESLRPDDYLGIVTFNAYNEWVVDITEVGQGMSLRLAQDAVSQIQASGGTLISAALEEAIAGIIQSSPTEYKHILLMSDGSGDEEEDTLEVFSVLAEIARRQNITISTIALGLESDPEAMAFIAGAGNGRFYEVLDPTDLPGVMVAESKAAHSENIQLGVTTPVAAINNHPVLAGFSTAEFPQIDGYNAVTSKAAFGAEDVLVSGNYGDPLLSTWQVGLGHVVTWMSDMGAEWVPGMPEWLRQGEFWKQVIYYTLPDPTFDLYELEISQDNQALAVNLDIFDFDGSLVNYLTPEFVFVDASQAVQRFDMPQTGLGEYRADLPLPVQGGYRGVILYSQDGENLEIGVPFVVNYPDEWAFDYSGSGHETITQCTSLDGSDLTSFDEELHPEEDRSWLSDVDPFVVLLVILLLSWPMEIAIRRWKMPWRRP